MKPAVLALVALAVGLGLGWAFHPSPPEPPLPLPAKADTVYYPLPVYERVQKLVFTPGPTEWLSDTVQVVYERIVTDTQYLGWSLPPTWLIDRVRAPETVRDTLDVSLVYLEADSLSGLKRSARIDRLWVGGPLRALDVVDGELRVDYWPPPEPANPNSFWRWTERILLFGGGVWLGSR